MTIIRVMIFALIPLLTTGCFSLFSGSDESDSVDAVVNDETIASGPEIKSSTAEEIELKIAKLWSRVSQLEEQIFRQREKVRVLEKGLMLGLVPEEMKEEDPYAHTPLLSEPPPPEPKKREQPASPLSAEEAKEYQAGLGKAHDLYRAGRYGVAIKAFTDVDEKFGEKMPDGVSKYWIAKCWVHLKEYSIAHQILVDFTKLYSGSAFLPRAKLEMARIQIHQGLRETAIENFRTIIEEYPYEDAAEMAKMELQRLENTL